MISKTLTNKYSNEIELDKPVPEPGLQDDVIQNQGTIDNLSSEQNAVNDNKLKDIPFERLIFIYELLF